MADRELRRMHRAELIEIIYALKQSEDQLKAQNAALTAQLQDRQLRLESAGSIAQAALELNNVFAAAQAAADDYLHSVQASLADTNATAANTLSQALSEAKRILEQAQARPTICWTNTTAPTGCLRRKHEKTRYPVRFHPFHRGSGRRT